MGKNHVDRGPADRNLDRLGRTAYLGTEADEAVGFTGAVADLKGKTVEFLRSQGWIGNGIVHVAVGVVNRGEVQGLVVRHEGLGLRLDRQASMFSTAASTSS